MGVQSKGQCQFDPILYQNIGVPEKGAEETPPRQLFRPNKALLQKEKMRAKIVMAQAPKIAYNFGICTQDCAIHCYHTAFFFLERAVLAKPDSYSRC